jgi:hypothetical protein
MAPGERLGRRATTNDPVDRDVRDSPHHIEGIDFTAIAEIFSAQTNAERKKAFDIRALMKAVDGDCAYPFTGCRELASGCGVQWR